MRQREECFSAIKKGPVLLDKLITTKHARWRYLISTVPSCFTHGRNTGVEQKLNEYSASCNNV